VIMPVLEPGRYRLRALNLPGSQHFRVLAEAEGATEMKIVANGRAWPEEEIILSPAPKLRLQNETDEEQLFILERTVWSDQAATAAEVISLQRFRDLFANEALRPGERIGVGRLTVLFTDLVDSTRLYREIGDAPAFGIVMDHFDVLREAIDAEGGAIVKTIGDAVMAAFHRPVSAVRAMTHAQAVLANPPEGKRPLYLKAAVHTGSSIAVTLNERLDYFGTTINIASRLEKFSRGNDIIISEAVCADPEVQKFLADFQTEPFSETLKGFDEECFSLYRVTPAQLLK
ncbi:MAG TPA: adenylate/guanylate cyclase domain-containing protein, partial [Anaerolineae bacterium]|nr:adenylate/guanylate cyclase domain-containing protein [Anaerolineae bacterium]